MSKTLNMIKEAVAAVQNAQPKTKKIAGVEVDKKSYNKMRNFVYGRMENGSETHDELKAKFHKKYPEHKKMYKHFVDNYFSGGDAFSK